MMKYIFCILLGVFLCWGFHLIFNEAQEAYRLEAGSNGIQTYSYSYTSKASIIQLDQEQNTATQSAPPTKLYIIK